MSVSASVPVNALYELHNVSKAAMPDEVLITNQMSGIEEVPENDWLHIALSAYRAFEGSVFDRAAFIGSANGVDVIAALRMMTVGQLTVTDILEEIMVTIKTNREQNTPASLLPKKIDYIAGRDCDELEGPFNFIYGNLPLIMVEESELDKTLSTTTLTDMGAYKHLAQGEDDILLK